MWSERAAAGQTIFGETDSRGIGWLLRAPMIYKMEKVEMRDVESSQRDGVQNMVDVILYSSLLCNFCLT